MPRPELDRTQWAALRAGGDAAGAYLDEIGRTDLATLTAEEWETFLAIALDQYGQALSTLLRANAAPF